MVRGEEENFDEPDVVKASDRTENSYNHCHNNVIFGE
jgi:hypothetical protein